MKGKSALVGKDDVMFLWVFIVESDTTFLGMTLASSVYSKNSDQITFCS